MEPSSSADQLRRLLSDLYVQPGVSGACLQLGDMVLVHDLPYSDDRVTNLAARIENLVGSYESVGRGIWQICAGYENFRLLILCHSMMRLTLLLRPETDPSLAAGRGMHLLMEVKNIEPRQAASPPPPVHAAASLKTGMPREDFEKLVSGLMGRVTGSAQAAKLIQRELATHGINGQLDPEEARRIGLIILEYIPNRGKRAALASEFLNALKP